MTGPFAARRRSLSQRLIGFLGSLFGGYADWRDPAAEDFVAQAVPVVQGTQRALGLLVAHDIAQKASTATDQLLAPLPLPDDVLVDLRPGVTADEVYQRPFATTRAAISRGIPGDRAAVMGANRLREVAEGDLQRTYAEASRAAIQALPEEAQPAGWRRRLVGIENCGLCVIASTQLYRTDELNPLHHGCNCEVDLAYGDEETSRQRLEQLHAAVEELTGKSGGLTGRGYHELLVSMTPEHGELGRMLVRPRDHFVTEADLPR